MPPRTRDPERQHVRNQVRPEEDAELLCYSSDRHMQGCCSMSLTLALL